MIELPNKEELIMKSNAMSLAAIISGLQLANPSADIWTTCTEVQQDFIKQYLSGTLVDLQNLKEYLEGIVTSDSAVINKWFADRGFPGMDINIPLGGQGVGTVFDLLVDWEVAGKKRDIFLPSVTGVIEGVQMEPSSSMHAWTLEGYEHPMFELETRQDDWKVFIVETDEAPTNLELPQQAMHLLSRQRTPFQLNKLLFPSVEMNLDVDVSFLVGMHNDSGFSIDEAIKKVKLSLDDKGARAQSAFYMVRRGLERGVYTIDKPFYVIFWKDGLNFPAFVAIAAPEHWKKK